jgi:hypothetical protein
LRPSPRGDWDVFADAVSIAGEEHRMTDCRDSLKGVSVAQRSGLPLGIRLQREPANLHDKYAIKVVGFRRENGWLSSKEHERHVGYIPRRLALRIANEIGDDPIAARLVVLESTETSPLNIVIDILEAAA